MSFDKNKFLNEFEKKTIISKLGKYNVVNMLLRYDSSFNRALYDVFFIYEGILFVRSVEYYNDIRQSSKPSNDYFLREVVFELEDELCSIDFTLFNREPIAYALLFNASKEVSVKIVDLFESLKNHGIYDLFFKTIKESAQNMCVKYLSNDFSRLNTYNLVISNFRDKSEEELLEAIRTAKDFN